MASSTFKKRLIVVTVLVAVAGATACFWFRYQVEDGPVLIASGNGRIEATEVNIATKYHGRIAKICCREGDFVQAGQIVARMDTQSLNAQLRQAEASTLQATHSKSYVRALVQQRKVQLAVAQKDYERTREAYKANKRAIAIKQLDHDRAARDAATALLAEAEARLLETEAAIQVAIAKTEEIHVNIEDCILKSTIMGRVLYRLTEPGEVLAAGGRVLTVLDLTDVYMTIFLPTTEVGRVRIGAEVRIALDALPDIAVPARVSFVAPNAQFTPKEVETRAEREKLMFRVKVKIDPELLMDHLEQVKTGVPGVAYVRLAPEAEWPQDIQRRSLP